MSIGWIIFLLLVVLPVSVAICAYTAMKFGRAGYDRAKQKEKDRLENKTKL